MGIGIGVSAFICFERLVSFFSTNEFNGKLCQVASYLKRQRRTVSKNVTAFSLKWKFINWSIGLFIAVKQNHRNTEWLRLEGTSGGCLVQLSFSGRAIWSRMPMTMSRHKYVQRGRLHNLSGLPVPVLSPSQWKSVFLFWDGETLPPNPSVSVCAHCLLSCHWAPLKRAWLHRLCTLLSDVGTYWWCLPEHSLLQAEQSQLSQPFLMRDVPVL